MPKKDRPQLNKERKTSAERSEISKNNMAKGTSFQRKVAKKLQEFFEAHGVEGEFHSTPRSGGLRWHGRSDVIGDVVTPENFRFTIECKKHSEIDLHCLFLSRSANTSADLINFWTQVCEDCVRSGRTPMLVFEQLRGKTIVVLPHSLRWSRKDRSSALEHSEVMTAWVNVLDINPEWAYVKLTRLETLLENTTPDFFKTPPRKAW